MPRTQTPHPVRRARVTAPLLAALLGGAALGACREQADRLLTVTTPSRLADDRFLVPANAQLIVNSAQADFECALGGYVVASGLAAGEFVDGSQTAARWSYDRRDVLSGDATYSTAGCTGLGVYTPISTARFTADQALRKLDEWTDAQVANRARLQARMALYAGFSYDLLAEGFCTAAVNAGPELQTNNMLDSAEARFTRAITLATPLTDTSSASVLNAAYVGRARVRLYKGDRAGAAQDAARVPVGFVFNATADANSDRRANRVFSQNNLSFLVTVAPAYRGLTVGAAADPRVRVTDGGRNASDQVNRLWVQQKYPTLTSQIPIATGVEAQLILAETQGASGGGVATLNALRARPGIALPALTAAEQADFTTTLFEERRRELFLQGARWFDLRRGNLPLVPPAGTAYAKGGTYGPQRCWPVPDVEKAANPNFRT